jgi:hypothetical protein
MFRNKKKIKRQQEWKTNVRFFTSQTPSGLSTIWIRVDLKFFKSHCACRNSSCAFYFEIWLKHGFDENDLLLISGVRSK